MKIIRNRQEFELTSEEMRQAYYEMKDKYIIEDICSLYNVPDEKIDETLTIFKRVIDGDDGFWASYWSIIEYVAEELGLEEKEG